MRIYEKPVDLTNKLTAKSETLNKWKDYFPTTDLFDSKERVSAPVTKSHGLDIKELLDNILPKGHVALNHLPALTRSGSSPWFVGYGTSMAHANYEQEALGSLYVFFAGSVRVLLFSAASLKTAIDKVASQHVMEHLQQALVEGAGPRGLKEKGLEAYSATITASDTEFPALVVPPGFLAVTQTIGDCNVAGIRKMFLTDTAETLANLTALKDLKFESLDATVEYINVKVKTLEVAAAAVAPELAQITTPSTS